MPFDHFHAKKNKSVYPQDCYSLERKASLEQTVQAEVI